MWFAIAATATTVVILPLDLAAPVFSAWFTQVFQEPTAAKIGANFLLLDFSALPVTWTMYVEIIGSIFVPVLLLFGRSGLLSIALCIGALAALSILAPSLLTTRYIFCFALGVALACCPALRLPSTRTGLAVLVAVALFFLERMVLVGRPIHGLFVDAAASVLLISAVISMHPESRLSLALSIPLLGLVGQSSYSLYLIHLPVLYGFAFVLNGIGYEGFLASVLLSFFGVAVSLAVAVVMYWLIERPTISAGRAFGRSLNLVRA